MLDKTRATEKMVLGAILNHQDETNDQMKLVLDEGVQLMQSAIDKRDNLQVTDTTMVWNSDLVETLELQNLLDQSMATIASQVGSDVPFFLHGGQAQVSGTGDRIKPNTSLIDTVYFVLILPNIHCSTARVYKTLDDMGHFDDLDQLNLTDLAVIGFNRLFQPACSVASELFGLYERINTFFPNQVFMSGSGSTLFIPCYSTKVQADVKQLLETKLDFFDGQIIVVNAVN